MFNRTIVMMGLSTMIFMSMGCSNTESKSVSNIKEKSPKKSTEQILEEVEMHGKFKRSFEIYELEANGKVYYVADPKQLLVNHSNGINQKGYYKDFEACVVGVIDSKGGYGPTGKYENEITVNELCA